MNLTNFSDTRFANSKRKVFKNILLMLGPIITVLEEQIMVAVRNRSGVEAANTDVRQNGDKAQELKGRILNEEFLLLLSETTDVHE